MASAAPNFIDIVTPPLMGFLINLYLCGILTVQVYIYYMAFPKDQLAIKAIVYTTFVLEVAQTIMKCRDRILFEAGAFTNPAILNDGQLSWFSVAILTPTVAAIVQTFFGYRIKVFSKSWLIASIVWAGTIVGFAGGIASGVLSAGVTLTETAVKTKQTVIVFVVGSVVTDVLIAGLLSFYLRRMKSGVASTDRLVTKIVRRTVETGTITAIWSALILILFYTAPPWFLMFSDSISKVYSNNLMVMFNRRIEFTAHSSNSSPSMVKGASTSSGSAMAPSQSWHVASTNPHGGMNEDVWELAQRKGSKYMPSHEAV